MHIGYCRISTSDQRPDLQFEALGEAGCDPIYSEIARGAKEDRPMLAEAIAYARKGDVLVVWKLDRLGRSLPHLLKIIGDLEERGIGFQSLTEQLNSTTPGGELIFSVVGAIAQFERDMFKERTLAGLAAARAQGRVGGRPKSLNESDLKYAHALMADSSIPMTEIAERLCVSASTLYKSCPGGRAAFSERQNSQ